MPSVLPSGGFRALSLPRFSVPNVGAALGVCGANGSDPHEGFALLCCLGFLLLQFAPRFAMRHAYCSLNALKGGRVWTAVTANLIHGHYAHLFHNALQVLHLGPVLHSALGCERSASLILLSCLATSAASVLWHGILGNRPGAGSVGASGVVMAFVSANAALFPHVAVRMYGFELTAAQVPLVYLLFDVLAASSTQGGRADSIDVSAHAGGALAGWYLGRAWKPWYL